MSAMCVDFTDKDRIAVPAVKVSIQAVALQMAAVSGPQVRWTMVPENTMKFARFMQSTGMLKTAPASWQDYFFSETHALGGS